VDQCWYEACDASELTNHIPSFDQEIIMAITTIRPQELLARRERGDVCELIDVCTPVEFHEVHVTFARNEPLDRLDPAALMNARDGSRPLYVIRRSSNRANQACEKFVAAGFTNIVNVEGGTQAWEQAGLPVTRGKKALSLERQARIAAGLLVLIGSVLGGFVSPYWLGLCAFVGAGLVFAGITDTCGMGLLLARMPWNQTGKSAPKAKEPPGANCSIQKPT
jgi:rhodanese-related sulfurtransferase